MEFVTKNNVKDFLKENKKRVATATYEALDRKIEAMLKEACRRADKNGRSTIMEQDL